MTDTAAATAEAPARAARPWGKLAAIAVLLVLLVLVGKNAGGYVQQFTQWVEGLGVWGPVVFVIGYAAAVVAFAPGSLLTLGAGAIFGLTAGSVYVFLAATLGACAAFLVARYLARSAIERKLEGNERFAAIDRAVGKEGRKIVFLLRLSPIFPFNLLNYALGLTSVRFADYAQASVGMLPGTLLYVYIGSVVGDLAALASGETGGQDTAQRIFFIVGLAITFVVTLFVTRVARRALAEATGE